MVNLMVIIVGLALAAFFAGTETAFVSNLYRKSTGLAEWWRRRPERLLATTLVGTNIAVVTATSIATELAIKKWGPHAEAYITILISVIGLIFCEVIPKSAALRYAPTWTRKTAPVLYFFHIILFPVVEIINAFSSVVTRFFEKIGEESYPQPVELMEFLRRPLKGFDSGRLLTILIFLRFAGKRVMELMLPINLAGEAKIGESAQKVHDLLRQGHPYVVVYDGERAVGVMDAALVGKVSPAEKICAEHISTEFVPETKDAAEFLREFMRKGNIPALVVDEHGEITGVIGGIPLIERMLRTRDIPTMRTLEIPGSSVVLPGDTPIERLELMTGIEIPRGQYQTIAGFVEEIIHRIPGKGEKLEWKQLRFEIVAADNRRIKKIRVVRSETYEA